MANTINELVANGGQMLSSINQMIEANHNLIFKILNWLKKFLAALFCIVILLLIIAFTLKCCLLTLSARPILLGGTIAIGFITWCCKDPFGMFADIPNKGEKTGEKTEENLEKPKYLGNC